MSGRRIPLAVILAALVLGAAVPAAASAAVSAYTANNGVVHVIGDAAPNSIHWTDGAHDSGSGLDFAAEIWVDGGTISLPASSGCLPYADRSPNAVICGASNGGADKLDIEPGGGDDHVTMETSEYAGQEVPLGGLTIKTGDGNDTVTMNDTLSWPTTVDLGAGDDVLQADEFGYGVDAPNMTVTGDDGNDAITTGGGNDHIFGGNGNDHINAAAGDDAIDGGAGNDNLDGGPGSDTITGGPGLDTVQGDDDPIYAGNDTINVVDGQRDTVSCGFGADTVHADPVDVVERGSPDGCESVLVAQKLKVSVGLPAHQHPVKNKEILAKVSVSGGTWVGAFARVKVGKGKPFEIDSNLFRLTHAGSKTIALHFSKKRLKALKSALKHHKAIVASVFGVRASDSNDDNEVDTPSKRLVIKS